MIVSVSPSARKSKLLSAALNVKSTEFVPDAVKEESSALTSPFGSELPPDQLAETRLEPTLLMPAPAKASVPETVSWSAVSPVWPASSVTRCGVLPLPKIVTVIGALAVPP